MNPMQSVNSRDASAEISIFEILGILWRGKILILLTSFLAALFGIYAASNIEHPGYNATSVIRFQQEQSLLDEFQSKSGGFLGYASSDYESINTELTAITSHNIIGKLVDRYDLINDPLYNYELALAQGAVEEKAKPSLASRIKRGILGDIQNDIGLEVPTRTQVIREVSSYFSVSHLPDTYLFEVTAWSDDASEAEKLSNALSEVYIQDSIDDRLEDSERSTIWLNTKAADLKQELEKSELQIKAFRESSSLVTEERLVAMNVQLKETRSRISISSAQLANLEDPASPAALRLSGQVKALKDAEANLSATIKEQSNDLVLLQNLQRESSANSLLYESFLARLKEITVQQGLLKSERRLLQPAEVTLAETQSRSSIVLLYTLMGGFLGAIALALKELMNNRIRVPEDLENLTNSKVFGTVPLVPEIKRENLLSYLKEKTTSSFSEAIRNLRTSIMLADIDKPPQVVMVTSTTPAEGKTTLSIALAQHLSGLSKKTLLIEGDMRKRVFSDYFDASNVDDDTRGTLLDVIQGTRSLADCCYMQDGIGIDFLFSGKTNINAADVFASKAFEDFIESARNQYDYIVIDTPPVLAVPDARLIAGHADSVVYVVKWNQTTKSNIRDGIAMFEDFGVAVDGLILSSVDLKELNRYGYGGRYSYRYGDKSGYHQD